MPNNPLGPRPGGNAATLNVSDSTVVKDIAGTLFSISVVTAGTTPGYAADAVTVPADPVLSVATSGALTGATYYGRTAYTDASHAIIGTLSNEISQVVADNEVLVMASPAAYPGAAGWIPFVDTTAGSETNQVATPIAIGTNWQEPDTGLIAGDTALAAIEATQICAIPNTVEPIELEWPCLNGITIVPGTGQVLSVSYQ